MPWATTEDLPPGLRNLDLDSANEWGRIYDALRRKGHSKESSARIAWHHLRELHKARRGKTPETLAMFQVEHRPPTLHEPTPEREAGGGRLVLLRSKSDPSVRRWQRITPQGELFHGPHALHFLLDLEDAGGAMYATRARVERPEVRALAEQGLVELHLQPARLSAEYRVILTRAGRSWLERRREAMRLKMERSQMPLIKGRIAIRRLVPLEKAGRPPAGYDPVPGSAHGGYRKRNAAGGWDYWYASPAHAARDAMHHQSEADRWHQEQKRLQEKRFAGPPGTRYGRQSSAEVAASERSQHHTDAGIGAAQVAAGLHKPGGHRLFRGGETTGSWDQEGGDRPHGRIYYSLDDPGAYRPAVYPRRERDDHYSVFVTRDGKHRLTHIQSRGADQAVRTGLGEHPSEEAATAAAEQHYGKILAAERRAAGGKDPSVLRYQAGYRGRMADTYSDDLKTGRPLFDEVKSGGHGWVADRHAEAAQLHAEAAEVHQGRMAEQHRAAARHHTERASDHRAAAGRR